MVAEVQTQEIAEPVVNEEPVVKEESVVKKKTVVKEKPTTYTVTENKLTTMGWGLYFVWLGIGFLGNIGMGMSLIGIGVISLGMQLARASQKYKMDIFWMAIGALFVLGGLWDLFNPTITFVPVILLVSGMLLLLSIARRTKS